MTISLLRCLADLEYPTYDIQHAIEYHYSAVATLYKVRIFREMVV